MTELQQLYQSMIEAMQVDALTIPLTAVNFYQQNTPIPDQLLDYHPEEVTFTSCQASKQASLGDALCLSQDNIGCIAAGISLGLIDAQQDTPMEGSRVYTDIMKTHVDTPDSFIPPTPKDFTSGTVYACHAAQRPDFALFGEQDSGRYDSLATAKKAVDGMMAIQPPTMRYVFFHSVEFDTFTITPDIIILSVRPVELTRIIQAYQFHTGKRVNASMGGIRAVNSDLIVRPYLTQDMNVSSYCLGARLIAQFEADRMGVGMPFDIFKNMVQGMLDSQTGFPFHLYPGADE